MGVRGGQSLFKPSQPPSCLSSPTTKTFSILNGLSFICCNIKCYISFFTSKPYFKKENFHIKFLTFFFCLMIEYSITRNIFRTCFIMCLFVRIVISVFLYKCISVLECRSVFPCLFVFFLVYCNKQHVHITFLKFSFFRFLFFLVRILLCSLMALALIA